MKKRICAIRAATLFVGALMIADGVLAAFLANLHSGIVFTFIFGAALIALAALYKVLRRIGKRILVAAFAAVFLIIAWISVLYIAGSGEKVSYDETAVIVLGSGLRGEEPSDSLKRRLDAAADYHFKNPEALIVVSGGRGTGEAVTEALAMERYLISCGVSSERIIREETSTSTSENFAASKKLLDGLLGEEYSVAYITSNFHVLRSRAVARATGFAEIGYVGARVSPILILPNGLRECAAILKYWLLKY